MGFMADRIQRLRRGKFGGNADMLAEEIIAAFSSDEPIQITSPLDITQRGTQPPINLNMHTDGNTIGAPITFTVVGPITSIPALPDGKFPLTSIPPPPPPPTGPPTGPVSPPVSGGSSNSYSAVVGSGSGQTYTCTLTGETGGSFTATVRMPMLANNASLDSGTVVPAIRVGSEYLGFPPVFLGPPA